MMMNLAGAQPQIWASIVVIIAASAIAIGYRKRTNSRRRAATAELRAVAERLQAGEAQPAIRQPELKAFAAAAPTTANEAAAPIEQVEAAPIAATKEMPIEPAIEPVKVTVIAPEAPPASEPEPCPIAEPPSQPEPAPVAFDADTNDEVEVFVDEALLEAMFGGGAEPQKASPRPRFEVIDGGSGIPAGLHDADVLHRLLDANAPYTGLVFALGITKNDGRAAADDIVQRVYHFVRGLLRDRDFACQMAKGEFLLLLPSDDAAASKRRIRDLTERLWDFQLRGIGVFTVLFSWGDVLVANEPLAEAVDSASERMYQTRRARKTVSMDFVSPRTTAVM